VRFDHLGFRCTNIPGWRGRNACAFFGRSTPGYLLSGLQPEEPGAGGTWRQECGTATRKEASL